MYNIVEGVDIQYFDWYAFDFISRIVDFNSKTSLIFSPMIKSSFAIVAGMGLDWGHIGKSFTQSLTWLHRFTAKRSGSNHKLLCYHQINTTHQLNEK